MKKEQISDSLNMLDDAIIEETNEIRSHKKGWRKIWGAWAATAACLALVAYAGIRVLPHWSPNPPSDLPLLSISEETGVGMGYEGYLAYDISELVSGNPWSEAMELSTLPVYQNRLTFDDNFIATGADFDKMQEIILEIAGRLGLDTSSLVITDNAPDEDNKQIITEKMEGDVPEGYFNPTTLIVQADGLKIEVDQTLTAKIAFDPPRALPDEYNYTYYAPYEDYVKVAEYLKNEYQTLMGIANPQIDIDGGDYNIYSDQNHYIHFYDAGADVIDRIINYNFHRISFYCDFDGKLDLVKIYHPDLSLKVGDYPIITADEARGLLLTGRYLTSVPYEIPGEDYIKKVELVYHTGELNKYFIPYYRFYVELPDAAMPRETREYGIKTYGAYYVPAVEGKYLTNMPIWDGQIN